MTHSHSTPRRKASRTLCRTLCLALACAGALGILAPLAPAGPSLAAEVRLKDLPEDLPVKYRQWLTNVRILLSEEELEAFLALQKDYQREAFIKKFWRVRDPDPRTARNEFRDRWQALIEQIDIAFEGETDDRARILLLNGPPAGVFQGTCTNLLWPIEIWYYAGSDRVPYEFVMVFYRRFGAGPFRIWHPADGLSVLFDPSSQWPRTLLSVANNCAKGDQLAGGISRVLREGVTGYSGTLARAQEEPDAPRTEWVSTFAAYSTDLPDGSETFDADLGIAYPGSRQSRTALQGLVSVPISEVGKAELAGARSFNFVLNGELILGDALFESFRYKFDLPESQVGDVQIPLIFERFVRPGEYRLITRLEDLNSGRFFRDEQVLTVPKLRDNLPPLETMDPATASLLAEANSILAAGKTTLQIVQPRSDLLKGLVRFDSLLVGSDVASVTFLLDDEPVLTKNRAPYSVELDLGDFPRAHTLRAVAVDAEGAEVASDEILLNAGGSRFRVHLSEPRPGRTYRSSLRAEAEISVPDNEKLERVEIFLNEDRIATLYSEPWAQPIVLPEENAVGYVRAVAYLDDGNSTEDAVFFNAPDYSADFDVQMVELFTTALDRSGRPVEGLERSDFRVSEDKVPQEILRFEKVRDLPIHAGILLDVSASMEDALPATRQAALQFAEQILEPKDRLALITFNDRPNLAVKFTNQLVELGGGLAGLKAERGTALYDSIVYSLFYFNGIRGQRALLLLSDGKDESSRFAWEEAIEFARRTGVTIYSIGLALPKGDARRKLNRLAEETGGRSFFVDSAERLGDIYAQIEEELRSQYLIAYQSTNNDPSGDFRTVDLTVNEPGVEVKTIRGYYP